jgi:hypothetical protein
MIENVVNNPSVLRTPRCTAGETSRENIALQMMKKECMNGQKKAD